MFRVMTPVVQYVVERAANFGGRAEYPRVVTVGEHAPASQAPALLRDRSVEPMRGSDLEALHAAGERAFIARLDDEMDVLALEADLADPEVGAVKRRR
jgi:hypothetical protein